MEDPLLDPFSFVVTFLFYGFLFYSFTIIIGNIIWRSKNKPQHEDYSYGETGVKKKKYRPPEDKIAYENLERCCKYAARLQEKYCNVCGKGVDPEHFEEANKSKLDAVDLEFNYPINPNSFDLEYLQKYNAEVNKYQDYNKLVIDETVPKDEYIAERNWNLTIEELTDDDYRKWDDISAKMRYQALKSMSLNCRFDLLSVESFPKELMLEISRNAYMNKQELRDWEVFSMYYIEEESVELIAESKNIAPSLLYNSAAHGGFLSKFIQNRILKIAKPFFIKLIKDINWSEGNGEGKADLKCSIGDQIWLGEIKVRRKLQTPLNNWISKETQKHVLNNGPARLYQFVIGRTKGKTNFQLYTYEISPFNKK